MTNREIELRKLLLDIYKAKDSTMHRFNEATGIMVVGVTYDLCKFDALEKEVREELEEVRERERLEQSKKLSDQIVHKSEAPAGFKERIIGACKAIRRQIDHVRHRE